MKRLDLTLNAAYAAVVYTLYIGCFRKHTVKAAYLELADDLSKDYNAENEEWNKKYLRKF